jgi:hypothetical protein
MFCIESKAKLQGRADLAPAIRFDQYENPAAAIPQSLRHTMTLQEWRKLHVDIQDFLS